MLRALVLVHRWLGIVVSLFFAMWFASGIVMHFVPFPALTESERVAGLAAIDRTRVVREVSDAVRASKVAKATRVRLVQRVDGPIILVSGATETVALHATDLSPAAVNSGTLAVAIAADHANRRKLPASNPTLAELAHHDQWTVPNGLDAFRPFFRIALNDAARTELYVSAVTGEVLRYTTRHERMWNYVGSVVHWIYPTRLRRNWAAWDRTVWTISLTALIAAASGAVLGVQRLRFSSIVPASPYRGLHAWHHWLGLLAMTFVLSWTFSGWLSMDHGRLFSKEGASASEIEALAPTPRWTDAAMGGWTHSSLLAREVEWFSFGGHIYRRERRDLETQALFRDGLTAGDPDWLAFLSPDQIDRAVSDKLGTGCRPAAYIATGDNYTVKSAVPNAPVYRVVCGDVWFQIDAATSSILERLDASRRAYRWFYSALHTLDFPALVARPTLRTTLILSLSGLGFVFSLTGIVIGWRRIRLQC